MTDASNLTVSTDAPAEQIPTLAEARKILLQKINDAIVRFLQGRNYPVGFDGITVPTISVADMLERDGNEESATIVISDGAHKRIMQNIRTALETVYTQKTIREKTDALEFRLLELDDELAQIEINIGSLLRFDHQGNKPSKERADQDIRNMKIRRDAEIPAEKREIQAQIQFLI